LFTQGELDATAEFFETGTISGWTLEGIRSDLLQKLATEVSATKAWLRVL